MGGGHKYSKGAKAGGTAADGGWRVVTCLLPPPLGHALYSHLGGRLFLFCFSGLFF